MPDDRPGRPPEEDLWFARHLQPHDALLRAWLRSRFPSEPDVDDVVQEAYLRVMRARGEGRLESPKAFLFTTARNLALDRARRRRVMCAEPLVGNEALFVLEGSDDVPETVARTQELEILTAAIQSLPERCRQVFTLRKVYGLSQREIARQLGISEHTVSAQLTVGVRRCTEYVQRYRREAGR